MGREMPFAAALAEAFAAPRPAQLAPVPPRFDHPLAMRSALGAWLPGKSEEECILRCGLGAAVLARIVDGAVEPEPDIARRIWSEVGS
jgi:hypothetical protein